jgi:hypothetical protein
LVHPFDFLTCGVGGRLEIGKGLSLTASTCFKCLEQFGESSFVGVRVAHRTH